MGSDEWEALRCEDAERYGSGGSRVVVETWLAVAKPVQYTVDAAGT